MDPLASYPSGGPISTSTPTTIGNATVPEGPSNVTFDPASRSATVEAANLRKAKAQGGCLDTENVKSPELLHIVDTANIVSAFVTPNLRVLLAGVLGAIDASIPNRDQNKAVKHIIRTQFDDAYFDILRRAYPDLAFGHSGGYAITPELDRSKAFAEGFLKHG